MNDLPREEQIKSRLREVTEESRRLRAEVEQLIRADPSRPHAFAHDRPSYPTAKRRRKPR